MHQWGMQAMAPPSASVPLCLVARDLAVSGGERALVVLARRV